MPEETEEYPMRNREVVYVDRGATVWKVIKILLVLAAVTFVAVKLYQKFAKKKQEEALAAADAEALLNADVDDDEDDEPFEYPAEAVIQNAANMN